MIIKTNQFYKYLPTTVGRKITNVTSGELRDLGCDITMSENANPQLIGDLKARSYNDKPYTLMIGDITLIYFNDNKDNRVLLCKIEYGTEKKEIDKTT